MGGLNTYLYVGANPLINFDPKGLYWGIGNSYRPENQFSPLMPESNPGRACRTACVVEFVNPIPGDLAELIIKNRYGDLAGHVVKKINKLAGAIDLGRCLQDCDQQDDNTVSMCK